MSDCDRGQHACGLRKRQLKRKQTEGFRKYLGFTRYGAQYSTPCLVPLQSSVMRLASLCLWLAAATVLPCALSQGPSVTWKNAVNVSAVVGGISRDGAPVAPFFWSAGAEAARTMDAVGFTASQTPDLYCGLELSDRPFSTSFNVIDYGFLLTSSGSASVVERGQWMKLAGAYSDGTTFKIVRSLKSKVRYYVNERLVCAGAEGPPGPVRVTPP